MKNVYKMYLKIFMLNVIYNIVQYCVVVVVCVL